MGCTRLGARGDDEDCLSCDLQHNFVRDDGTILRGTQDISGENATAWEFAQRIMLMGWGAATMLYDLGPMTKTQAHFFGERLTLILSYFKQLEMAANPLSMILG